MEVLGPTVLGLRVMMSRTSFGLIRLTIGTSTETGAAARRSYRIASHGFGAGTRSVGQDA
jgi:hypothetical protein